MYVFHNNRQETFFISKAQWGALVNQYRNIGGGAVLTWLHSSTTVPKNCLVLVANVSYKFVYFVVKIIEGG